MAQGNWPSTGGGGGATTYAALTDAASVDLPGINTPLAAALEAAGGPTQLDPVDYLDENFSDFSSGVVDTTQEPYNSTATEGQSVICAYPDTPADAGIWVLGDVTDPAAVPVTRRADALVGTTFTKGQVIRVGSSIPPSTFARCLPDDASYTNWQDTGVVGTDILQFDPCNDGGEASIASGPASTATGIASVASGFSSTASGNNSIASGSYSTASGSHSIASGDSSTASGDYSIASGNGSVASGNGSVASGSYSVASGPFSIANGNGSKARVYGAEALAASMLNTPGDAQVGRYVLLYMTADSTPTKVLAGYSEDLVLPDNASFDFSGRLVAREPATGDSKCWKFEGLIKRGADASTTTLVGAVTPVAGDSGASAWTIAVTADTSAGALAVTVTGEADKTIQWVCSVNTVETIG